MTTTYKDLQRGDRIVVTVEGFVNYIGSDGYLDLRNSTDPNVGTFVAAAQGSHPGLLITRLASAAVPVVEGDSFIYESEVGPQVITVLINPDGELEFHFPFAARGAGSGLGETDFYSHNWLDKYADKSRITWLVRNGLKVI